jgi:hypothetical protein
MVYINLSVYSFEESESFYCDLLQIFDSQSGARLICNSGPELILDLIQVGSERHIERFGVKDHSVSSFWIRHDETADVTILDRLKNHKVDFEEVVNLGGHYLKFKDPSGNHFTIHGVHGVIK